jgi:Fe-S cluster biogenesis protein NfuA
MAAPSNPDEVGSRIELLLGELRSLSDEATRNKAEELVRLLVEFYGAGLGRMVELAGEQALERFVEDELVASLLVLHGLHPRSTQERVLEALDKVRPYLGTHAGGVELLGVDAQGTVRLRLQGTCDGCPSSTVTVKHAIERAIQEAAPEVTGVEVEGMTADAGGPRLLQIRPFSRQAPGPCPVPAATATGAGP